MLSFESDFNWNFEIIFISKDEMKLYLIKISIFTFLLLGICLAINFLLPTQLKGDGEFELKLKYFAKEKKHDVVFLGSSRTFRHISPAIFDSIAYTQGLNFKSFNAGSRATFYPEAFYLLDKILETKKPKIVFFELQPVNDIGRVNLFSLKSYYYLDGNYIDFINSYLLSSSLSYWDKLNFKSKYYLAWSYKLLFGHFAQWMNYNSAKKEILGKNNDGFLPLLNGKKKLVEDTMKVYKRGIISTTYFASANKPALKNPNDFYVDYLLDLHDELAKKGIELYFVIPPRLMDYDSQLALLKHEKVGSCVIEMANMKEFPEFYQIKYTFDLGHLNKAGAIIYSEKFARKFLKVYLKKNE